MTKITEANKRNVAVAAVIYLSVLALPLQNHPLSVITNSEFGTMLTFIIALIGFITSFWLWKRLI